MTKKPYCIIIPAIKKNAAIPDQLVKKLNGINLIQRAINTSKEIARDEDIFIVTDSQEITLIAERNNVHAFYKQSLDFRSQDLLNELRFFNTKRAIEYRHLIIYRASTPLITSGDMKDAYERICGEDGDILVTLRRESHRLWKQSEGQIDGFFFIDEPEQYFSEIRAFMILHARFVLERRTAPRVIPWELEDNAIEINSYQDWWICEKLLSRKRILFVVAGNPSIGMGHIYRSLALAHEISEHEILFLCTEDSELAVRSIAERDYKTFLQSDGLINDVLAFEPDLVIHDMLNTDSEYIWSIKDEGIAVINFEDLGSGAHIADLTINELFEQPLLEGGNFRWGKEYYLLRDEFIDAKVQAFPEKVRNVLLTFGGTDPSNYTLRMLRIIMPYCVSKGIHIHLVLGSGYKYRKELELYLVEQRKSKLVTVHEATPVISRIMEQCQVAIASNGRTVFELAHMRIPSIILSHYEREETHDAAVEEFGFMRMGLHRDDRKSSLVVDAFTRLVEDKDYRKLLYDNSGKMDFARSRKNLIREILNFL